MGLIVREAGLLGTIQDRGRTGYRAFGVPTGGVFDRRSAGRANALVGNPIDAAVLELTLLGGVFEADSPVRLGIAGAPMPLRITRAERESRSLEGLVTLGLDPGDRLELGVTAVGARTYLAAAGGWQTRVILGSRSSETRVVVGQHLPAPLGTGRIRRLAKSFSPRLTEGPLRLIEGPDARMVEPALWELSEGFLVRPESNRVGLRLQGPTLRVASDPSRISTPVAPGAIQAAGGQPLILGVACGTMGGYPHIAHVINADLDRLGQTRPGDVLRFERVSLQRARELDREERLAAERERAWLSALMAD